MFYLNRGRRPTICNMTAAALSFAHSCIQYFSIYLTVNFFEIILLEFKWMTPCGLWLFVSGLTLNSLQVIPNWDSSCKSVSLLPLSLTIVDDWHGHINISSYLMSVVHTELKPLLKTETLHTNNYCHKEKYMMQYLLSSFFKETFEDPIFFTCPEDRRTARMRMWRNRNICTSLTKNTND